MLHVWLRADLSIITAWRADPYDLMFRRTARNSNPVMAMAGNITVAEVEQISNRVRSIQTRYTPGIYVDSVVLSTINEERRT